MEALNDDEKYSILKHHYRCTIKRENENNYMNDY